MPRVQTIPSFFQEVAALIASSPTREELLNFHPSKRLQRYACKLLQKQNDDLLSSEEKRQLDEFISIEKLMRLVKAQLHAERRSAS